jgi:hypothetical protein
MTITSKEIIMKALLVALPFNTIACGMSIIVICIGCRIEQTTNPTSVSVEGIGTSDQSAGQVGNGVGVENVPQPGEIVLTFNPPEVEGAPGDNVNVVVTAIGPNGLEIPSFNVESGRSSNPFIASVSQIDGRVVQYRLNNIGATSAIIKAAGTERSILIWVN